MAKHKKSALTENQAAYVEAVMTGQSVTAAVQNPTLTSRSETVIAELARVRAEITDLTTLKRLDVLEGMMRGIQIAEMVADAGNVIRGWAEIAKILGHYAPEVKQINLNVNQQRLRSKFEELSDEDLLAIAEGRTIEGEFTRG